MSEKVFPDLVKLLAKLTGDKTAMSLITGVLKAQTKTDRLLVLADRFEELDEIQLSWAVRFMAEHHITTTLNQKPIIYPVEPPTVPTWRWPTLGKKSWSDMWPVYQQLPSLTQQVFFNQDISKGEKWLRAVIQLAVWQDDMRRKTLPVEIYDRVAKAAR